MLNIQNVFSFLLLFEIILILLKWYIMLIYIKNVIAYY